MLVTIGIDPGPRNCGVSQVHIKGPGENPILVAEDTIVSPLHLRGRDAARYIMDEIQVCYFPLGLNLLGIEDFDYQGHTISSEAHATYLLVGALDELRHQVPEVLWFRAGIWGRQLMGQGGYSDRQLRAVVNLRLGLPQKYHWSSEHSLDAAGIALVASDQWMLAQAAGVKTEEIQIRPAPGGRRPRRVAARGEEGQRRH